MLPTMKNRTYVIVHGSWQCSQSWQTIGKALHLKGYEVKLIDLPGHGKNKNQHFSHITFQTYIEYMCKELEKINEQNKLILIGHSFAGFLISKLIEYVSIDNLVYVTACLPMNKESLLSLIAMNDIPGLKEHIVIDKKAHATYLKKEGLAPILFNGSTQEIIETALSTLTPEPMHPPSEKISINTTLLEKIPKDYIECTEDRCVSIALQRKMHKRYTCKIHTLNTGHSPFLSMPQSLTEILLNKLSMV